MNKHDIIEKLIQCRILADEILATTWQSSLDTKDRVDLISHAEQTLDEIDSFLNFLQGGE